VSELSQYLPEVTDLIQGVVNHVATGQPLAINQPLYELGIDSLATVNLLVEMAQHAQVDLDDFIDDIDPPKTVGDLCQVAATLKDMKLCN
jgi:acyl carrier protein